MYNTKISKEDNIGTLSLSKTLHYYKFPYLTFIKTFCLLLLDMCSSDTEASKIIDNKSENSKQSFTIDTMRCDEKENREKLWKKNKSVKLEQKVADFNIG